MSQGLVQVGLKRTIYNSSKLIMDTFMYTPMIDVYKNIYTISMNISVSIHPPKQLDPSWIFRFTAKDLFRAKRFFQKTIDWFYDTSKANLFMYDDDNRLIFNNDYNDLNEYLECGFRDVRRLKSLPTILEYDGRQYEGVALCINKKENMIGLTLLEFEEIYSLILDFNASTEALLLLQTLNNSDVSNKIEYVREKKEIKNPFL